MIRTAIQQPIRSGIRTGINALGAAIRAVFNGVDQYITIPTLTYTGANFTKSFQWTYDSGDSGSKVFILGSGQDNTYGLYKSTSDYITFSYVNKGATQTTITLSSLTLVDGTKYTITIGSDGNGVTLSAGGQSASSTAVFNPSSNTYTSMMADDAPGNHSAGSLRNAIMTDGSYIQNGDFLQANGTDVYVGFPSITLAGDHEIELYVSSGLSAFSRLFGKAGDFDSRGYVSTVGAVNYTDSSGTPVTSSAGVVTANQAHKIKYVVAGTSVSIFADDNPVQSGSCDGSGLIIDYIHRQNSAYGVGVVSSFKVTDNETGDTYQYNLNDIIDNEDGTGTAPNSGNTGSSYAGTVYNYDPGTDLTTVANNSRRYPINDKEATITDVVGGQDGTMQNHSADMWQ